ncbi:TetR/AcrR family transcriptional regulator [Chondromyces apiculatus]|uniref:Transcriptional regulator, TetR family n=1 Tax=Chondromyces apiculatus DSM 436 TaxID=1192034 RepID=A0A017SXU8_9BACT|nr:TetR/AcrR family transcriptional regulator [Chondromyces apiculatus]EYF01106.1 Transcriptional regulator, TetR family [Chondromyces apiculatus DSM 436]
MSQTPAERSTRRTEGIRSRGRSARIVQEVLTATAEELGRSGYAALRIEDVAERAGVNKTTIYRRWPTKAALVTTVLRELLEPEPIEDTGAFDTDLLAVLRSTVALLTSPLGRGLGRMIQTERAHPEVEAIIRELRQERQVQRLIVVERALQRGELPPGTDGSLLVELAFSAVFSRLVKHGEPVDEAYLAALVHFVASGARAGHAIPPSSRP